MDQFSAIQIRLIITLKEAQILTGQNMILVAWVKLITRKVSAALGDKSIFARSQNFTFDDRTCTSSDHIDNFSI